MTAQPPSAIVTGASRGIGLAIARALVESGYAEHRAHAVDAAVERFGRLDALVANAGINPLLGPLADADLGAVDGGLLAAGGIDQ